MRSRAPLLFVLVGCSAARPTAPPSAAHEVAAPVDAAAVDDVAPTADATADARAADALSALAAIGTVSIALPDGTSVTLDAQHPEYTTTATLGATAGGEAIPSTPMDNGSDPFHADVDDGPGPPPENALRVPRQTTDFRVTITGSVPVLSLGVAGAAGAGLWVQRQRPGLEVSALVGGGRVTTATLRQPPEGAFSVTPVSPTSGRGVVALRFSLGTPSPPPDPGPSAPPPGVVYASFHAEGGDQCPACERWSVRLRGAVTQSVPAGRAEVAQWLYQTTARLAGPNERAGFQAMTSGGNEDAYAWRVRAQGASWIVEHGVSSRAWRRVGAFTLPAGATLEPDPDGVYR